MKHIKQFEKSIYKNDRYWLVPTDDRFKDSLLKIKCPLNWHSKFLNNIDIENNSKYIFIGYENKNDNEYWGWNYYNGKQYDKFYEENDHTYMGTVNIPEYELNVEKYNI